MDPRLPSIVVALIVMLGCQAPFGTDRHDLVGDRVAAMTIVAGPEDQPDTVRASVWLVVDGHPWSDVATELRWYWLDPSAPDVDVLDPLDPADGIGPYPLLQHPDPGRAAVLGVIARFGSGAESRSQFSLAPGAPSAFAQDMTVSLSLPQGLVIDTTTPEQLDRQARLDIATEPADFVPVDRWARLEARFDGRTAAPAALSRVRWMATAGTFLELDATRSDWAPSDLVLDDLEVDSSTPLAAGPVTVLGLALDDAGTNLVHAAEVWVGPVAGPGVRVRDRWLPTDVEAPAGATLLRGVLAIDDASPTGIRLDDIEAVALETLFPYDPFGTEGLACDGDVGGPFDPSWLFDGRCLRERVAGSRVVVRLP